ncbi:CDP-glucose 4,6-dehydratase [Halosquirtibacter xylanolyticus]|uniref:CDP-glucose 4,6-dehydratase n=1 Tax=Halosquirtibacter xylanolyticus TaxID=3374599 RepID=UPI003749781F|nr:CDP-glucose 4,6-dehydratase [Prolixibacteraceae bacterium]
MTIQHYNNFYKGKKVLVTGHTGFKGSWLSIFLLELGAEVIGYSLDPISNKDNFSLASISSKIIDIRGDIKDKEKLYTVFAKYKPEIVFHLAAQALVRDSYLSPIETYETNVMGTIHVMEAIRQTPSVQSSVLITTDKCYENKEQLWGYKETDSLGGFDPYSSSKGACEIAIQSWQRSFFSSSNKQTIASVRAGNVIGGGDWANDRIIPDCIRSIESNIPIEVRSPKSIRPWEHVLEPLSGYLLLAQKMWDSPGSFNEPWNFGPHLESVIPVWDIATKIVNEYGCGQIIDISSSDHPHEAKLLSLDISKTFFKLGWKPKLNIDETIKLTVDWYKRYQTENVYNICADQIHYFLSK